MSSRRETIGVMVFAAGIAMLVAGLALGIALTTGLLAGGTKYEYSYTGPPPLATITLPKKLPQDLGEGAAGRGLLRVTAVNGTVTLAVKYDNETRILIAGNKTGVTEIFGVWSLKISSLTYTGRPVVNASYTIIVEEYPAYLYIVDAVIAVLGAVLAASGIPHVVGRLSKRF